MCVSNTTEDSLDIQAIEIITNINRVIRNETIIKFNEHYAQSINVLSGCISV